MGERAGRVAHDEPHLDELLQALRAAETTGDAALALAAIHDPRVVDALLAALQDAQPLVRNFAAFALGEQGDPRAVAPLAALLTDPDPGVRARAAEALGRLGDASVLPQLAEALQTAQTQDAHLALQIIVAIADLGGHAAVGLLLPALASPLAAVRKYAAHFLGYIGDHQTAELLRARLAEENDVEVRSELEEAVTYITGDALSSALAASIRVTGGRKADAGVLAVWRDGFVVWSADQRSGGPPYSAGWQTRSTVEQALAAVARLAPSAGQEEETAEAPERLLYTGPGARWVSIELFFDPARRLQLGSWHDLYEANLTLVATETGIEPLSGRDRQAVLAAQSAAYQVFRRRWQAIKERLLAIPPAAGDRYDPDTQRPLPW